MNEEKHNTMIYWFCIGLTCFACILIFCFLYVPIPASNKSYADVILGFITGTVFATAINYLLGGNPKRNESQQITQTGDSPQTIVNPANGYQPTSELKSPPPNE